MDRSYLFQNHARSQSADYHEKAIIIVSDKATLRELPIFKLLKKFFKSRTYSKESLNCEVSLHPPQDGDGNDYNGYILCSNHQRFTDSIIEWHKKFGDFVKFLVHDELPDSLMVKFISYDGSIQIWTT